MEVWRWCPYVADPLGSITRSNIPPMPGREVAERGAVETDEGLDSGDSGIPARPAPDCNFSSEDSRECATARKAAGFKFTGLTVFSHPSLSLIPLPLPLLSSLFEGVAARGENFKGSCRWSGSVCDGAGYCDGAVSVESEGGIKRAGTPGGKSPLL